MTGTREIYPGERLPDFERHDGKGAAFRLHRDACAHHVILVLVREPQHPALADELEMLNASTWPDPSQLLIMVIGGPSAARDFEQRHPGKGLVIGDDGAVMGFLLAGSAAAPMDVLVLDRAHRLLEHLQPGETKLAERARDVLESNAHPPGRLVGAQAPVLVIPDVFEPEFCRHLIDVFNTRGNEPSGVLKEVDGKKIYEADRDTKIRREHRVKDGDVNDAVVQRVQRRVLPAIQWAFNFEVTQYEGIKIVLYDGDQGGYFVAHRDNDGEDTAHRRFAMTLNLNSEDYDGGELRFPEFSNDLYKPPSGHAVIFSCSLAHEALPVKAGQRFALVSFFFGRDDRFKQVLYEDRVGANQTPQPRWG
jgi:predicted 2-oxoglutarate/Fe(II)-dependent dioxygenase YbiX